MTPNPCTLPEPLRLTGNNSRNWREFKEQLQWFLVGTKSTDKLDAAKIGIMLVERHGNYKTLAWMGCRSKETTKSLTNEQFCSPQKNILYEYHGFWIMQQEDSESVDSYLTRLKLKVSMTRLVGLQQ